MDTFPNGGKLFEKRHRSPFADHHQHASAFGHGGGSAGNIALRLA